MFGIGYFFFLANFCDISLATNIFFYLSVFFYFISLGLSLKINFWLLIFFTFFFLNSLKCEILISITTIKFVIWHFETNLLIFVCLFVISQLSNFFLQMLNMLNWNQSQMHVKKERNKLLFQSQIVVVWETFLLREKHGIFSIWNRHVDGFSQEAGFSKLILENIAKIVNFFNYFDAFGFKSDKIHKTNWKNDEFRTVLQKELEGADYLWEIMNISSLDSFGREKMEEKLN